MFEHSLFAASPARPGFTAGLRASAQGVPPADEAPAGCRITLVAGTRIGMGNVDGRGRDAYFSTVHALAAADTGHVWIADTDTRALRRMTPDGTVATVARFNAPRDLAATPGGGVFMLDSATADANAAPRHVEADGTVTGVPLPAAGVVAITTAPDGTLHAATRRAVYRATRAGWRCLAGADDLAACAGARNQPPIESIGDIAVDAGHNVFVLAPQRGAVLQVGADGDVRVLAQGLARPAEIAVDAAGAPWVLEFDAGFACLRRVAHEGGAGTPFRLHVFRATRCEFERGFAVAANGDVLVGAGGAITRVTRGGAVTHLAGQRGESDVGIANVLGLGVDAAGNAVLAGDIAPIDLAQPHDARCDGSHHQVMRFSPDGELLATHALATDALPAADSVAVHADGSLSVGTVTWRPAGCAGFAPGGGAITRLRPDGTTIDRVATWPVDSGPIAPGHLALGRDGALYCVDLHSGDVVRVCDDGRAFVLARAGFSSLSRHYPPASRHLAADAHGRVYTARGTVVRRVQHGGFVTVAGSAGQIGSVDGVGASARFTAAGPLAIDCAGNVYIGDGPTIRRMTPAGVVTTVAGRAGERGLNPARGTLGVVRRLAVSDDGGVLHAVADFALVRIALR